MVRKRFHLRPAGAPKKNPSVIYDVVHRFDVDNTTVQKANPPNVMLAEKRPTFVGAQNADRRN
jgi:hypothetical protein